MERSDLIKDFLKKNKLDEMPIEWMPSDASFRHYARIKTPERNYILMDAPKPEKPEQFVVVDKILEKNGLSVPKIYDSDFENGFVLLEDFGDDTYARMLAKGADELELYKTALSSLVKISEVKDFDGIPLYDDKWLKYALTSFTDWFIPNALNRELTEEEKNSFNKIWNDLYVSIEKAPKGLILIDYHIDNMIHLNDRKGYKACGLLDFQDAKVGPLAYDLASLIEDARRDVPKNIREEILNGYIKAFPKMDKDLFMRSYHIVAAKRHVRVIGVFTRLKARDGKDKYLKHIPRVWKLLEEHLDEPYMQPLKNWLDKVVPTNLRKTPERLLV
ncbi:MAG: phosphotransferase [Alphaproteobacteria bacterium]|nr:phosphotransferase [Alphaproteobacteria bacterium]